MPEDENREILNTLAKGAGITAFGMFASKFFTYLYRALVGRALGPEAYGQLSIGMMIVGIGITLAGGPVRNGLKKFIPEYREKEDLASIKGVILSALGINLVGSIFIGGVIFFSAEILANQVFNTPDLVPIIRGFAVVPLLSRFYNTFIDVTIAYNTARYKVITTNFFQNIVQLLVTAALILLAGMGVMGAVWGWIAGVFFAGILAFYFMERKLGPILTSREKPNFQYGKLIKYSYPLILSGIMGILQGWVDTAFLGYYMDSAAVGLYNAAYPTAVLILLPEKALGTLTLSSFSTQGAREGDQGMMLKTTARWVFMFTFPSFLIMSLFSGELLHLLFGSQYTQAGLALSILALGNLAASSTGHIADLLKSKGYTRAIFYNNFSNLILNVILNILLIPHLGIVGAAVATASSNIFVNILLAGETWRYEKINPFSKKIFKTLISGLLSLGITYLIFEQLSSPAPYWILVPAGIVFFSLYALILLKIGGLTDYDKEIIHTVGRKTGWEKEVRKLVNILT